MAFPSSPTNGQTSVVNGIKYSYNSTYNSWTRVLSISPVTATNVITTNANTGNYYLALGDQSSGTANVWANTYLTYNANTDQLNVPSVLVSSGLTVSGTSNLGSISNVKITGGSANYVIQTDGNGNLSWTAQTSGNGSGGGSANTSSLQTPLPFSPFMLMGA
jgi:hypothetical protein